jgi:hypothetical protein
VEGEGPIGGFLYLGKCMEDNLQMGKLTMDENGWLMILWGYSQNRTMMKKPRSPLGRLSK